MLMTTTTKTILVEYFCDVLDYDSPRPRTNRQQLNVSGTDVTTKGIRRHGSLSSDARTPSDSVSSNDGSPHFRQPLNGERCTGDI